MSTKPLKPVRAPQQALKPQAIQFRVEPINLNAHLFQVTLTIQQPAADQRVSLPVWIPGSYLVREFPKNLQGLQAHQGRQLLEVVQLDKCSWQVNSSPGRTLVLRYEVCAFDSSVRAAWLDASRGFFNGTSLCLRVAGQTGSPHQLTLVATPAVKQWHVATGLAPVKVTANGFGTYTAADYDELADCPVEMGNFWSGSFAACGVPHRFVVAGAAPSFDGARLLADAQKICETGIRLWHATAAGSAIKKTPHKNYLFMLNAVDDGYGGLEHRNSTALICNRKDLPRLGGEATAGRAAMAPGKPPASRVGKQPDGYTTLLGLISHEYFHTWNVKRLRPAEFAQYDYGRENYTSLLWFFEGFTSYYDDLVLRRARLIDDSTYLRLLTKTINQVLQSPGRAVQSVAQASFDAWVKYYRQDENTPNATVSYYTKGALVALCLDLTLRLEGQKNQGVKTTLDTVMRALWVRCKAGPMAEADLAAVLFDLGGRSYAQEIADWVHSTQELPLQTLLEASGITVLNEPAQMAQALGLRVAEGNAVQIKTVLRGGAAELAGFAAGDEWLGLETGTGKSARAWRIARLDDVAFYAGNSTQVKALVARDKRLLNLALTLPKAQTTWRLAVRDPAAVAGWLGG